ncbi:MAG TPA: hypothetical protein VF784_09170 [Anaerolineales bacterium]
MNTQTPKPTRAQSLERILAVLAAAACLLLTIGIWRSVSAVQGMWPLPGLYFVELPAVGILSALLFVGRHRSSAMSAWVATGIYFAFTVLGVLSVGLFYLPIAVMFLMVAVVATVRQEQPVLRGLGALVAAALAQAVLMGIFIRLL